MTESVSCSLCMPEHAPNFLTCPGVPELTPPDDVSRSQNIDEADAPATLFVEPVPKLVSPPPAPVLPPSLPPPSPPVPPLIDHEEEVVPGGDRGVVSPHPAPWWMRFVGIVLSLLLIAGFVWFAYGVVRIGLAVQVVRISLQNLQTAVQMGDLTLVYERLETTSEDLSLVQDRLAYFAGWEHAPFVGADVQTLQDLTRTGGQVIDGGKHALHAAASFQQALQAAGVVRSTLTSNIAPSRRFIDISIEEKRQLLTRLQETLPELRVARDEFAIAADSWSETGHDERVLALVPAAKRFVDELPALKRQTDQAIAFLEVFLPLVGASKEQNYLVLLQNADELRPTGGFIGTVGYLRVDAATLNEFRFEDVYAIDNPVSGVWKDVPPEPLQRELGVTAWYLRDRNWSPDFPTSAEDIMKTYEREKGLVSTSTTPIHLDGVIALEPELFKRLLQFTGPVTIAGKTYSAETFFDQLEFDSEMGFHMQGIPVERRKDMVLQVGNILMERLLATPASRWGDLLDLLTNSLEEKDVLFALRDPKTLALLDRRGWTGRVGATPQDFLWVIDANLAALKTDGVMDKEIQYHLDTTAQDGPLATVTLKYHNTNRSLTWRYTRYRDYVRIYVPEGSTLVSSAGAMRTDKNLAGGKVVPGTVDVMRDLGKTVFGAFWSIEPGETRTLTFTYRLPQAFTDQLFATNRYQLLVQRQPGAYARLTLDHVFGKNIRAANPSEDSRFFGDARYQLSQPITRDKMFDIRF